MMHDASPPGVRSLGRDGPVAPASSRDPRPARTRRFTHRSLDWSAGGERLAYGTMAKITEFRGGLTVWDQDGKELFNLDEDGVGFTNVALSPDGTSRGGRAVAGPEVRGSSPGGEGLGRGHGPVACGPRRSLPDLTRPWPLIPTANASPPWLDRPIGLAMSSSGTPQRAWNPPTGGPGRHRDGRRIQPRRAEDRGDPARLEPTGRVVRLRARARARSGTWGRPRSGRLQPRREPARRLPRFIQQGRRDRSLGRADRPAGPRAQGPRRRARRTRNRLHPGRRPNRLGRTPVFAGDAWKSRPGTRAPWSGPGHR